MLKNMDRLGKIVNTAYIVSAASMFAAHIGFTMNVQPDLLGALIAAKLTGGFTAALLAVFLFKNKMPENRDSGILSRRSLINFIPQEVRKYSVHSG